MVVLLRSASIEYGHAMMDRGGAVGGSSPSRGLMLRVCGAFLAVLSAAACTPFASGSQLLEEGELPSTDEAIGSSMPGEGQVSGADWGCLDEPEPPAPAGTNFAGAVRLSVPVVSLFGAPLVDVAVNVCLPADPSCATPIASLSGLDEDGRVNVDVPTGFNGFFELRAAGHLPTVFYMRQPVLEDTDEARPLTPIPAEGVEQLAQVLVTQFVAELGLVAVAVVDCAGARAPGVAFANDLGGRGFYFADGLPSVSADSTDPDGLGGFVNVPLRLLEVEGRVAGDGRLIGRRSVLPRAGWLSIIQIRHFAVGPR